MTDYSCRITRNDTIRRYTLCHYTTGTDDGTVADGDTFKDDATSTDEDVVADNDRLAERGIGFVFPSVQIVDRMGIGIGDEAARADKHIVANSDRGSGADAAARNAHVVADGQTATRSTDVEHARLNEAYGVALYAVVAFEMAPNRERAIRLVQKPNHQPVAFDEFYHPLQLPGFLIVKITKKAIPEGGKLDIKELI